MLMMCLGGEDEVVKVEMVVERVKGIEIQVLVEEVMEVEMD